MNKPRIVAASVTGFLGLALVATPASADITSVDLSSTEAGNDIGISVTGNDCLAISGNLVSIRVASIDSDEFVNDIFGVPDLAGDWTATGSVDLPQAGDYVVRALCHFEGEAPDVETDLIGSSEFTLTDPGDPGDPTDPPDPGDPTDPPGPSGPGEDDPPTPEDPGTEPETDGPADEAPEDEAPADDGEDDDSDDDDGTIEPVVAADPAAPASAPAAVTSEPDLTG